MLSTFLRLAPTLKGAHAGTNSGIPFRDRACEGSFSVTLQYPDSHLIKFEKMQKEYLVKIR